MGCCLNSIQESEFFLYPDPKEDIMLSEHNCIRDTLEYHQNTSSSSIIMFEVSRSEMSSTQSFSI